MEPWNTIELSGAQLEAAARTAGAVAALRRLRAADFRHERLDGVADLRVARHGRRERTRDSAQRRTAAFGFDGHVAAERGEHVGSRARARDQVAFGGAACRAGEPPADLAQQALR